LHAVSSALRARIKHFLKRLIVVGVSSALGVTAFAYAVDYAVFRYRVAANRQPFGQITVSSYDAVQQKSGKTEFIFNPPEAKPASTRCFHVPDMCPAGICSGIANPAPTSEQVWLRSALRFFAPGFGYNGLHSDQRETFSV
jgi:hypothetical protein